MNYEDLKPLADIVNYKYSWYKQHGKGKEAQVMEEIVIELMNNTDMPRADKIDGIDLFYFGRTEGRDRKEAYVFNEETKVLEKINKETNINKGTWFRTSGRSYPIGPRDGKKFSLEELQAYCDGFIQIMDMKSGQLMIVNEDVHNQKINKEATDILHNFRRNNVIKIVGDAVVIDEKDFK